VIEAADWGRPIFIDLYENAVIEWRRGLLRRICPLMAQSRLSELSAHLSAFGTKADMSRRIAPIVSVRLWPKLTYRDWKSRDAAICCPNIGLWQSLDPLAAGRCQRVIFSFGLAATADQERTSTIRCHCRRAHRNEGYLCPVLALSWHPIMSDWVRYLRQSRHHADVPWQLAVRCLS